MKGLPSKYQSFDGGGGRSYDLCDQRFISNYDVASVGGAVDST